MDGHWRLTIGCRLHVAGRTRHFTLSAVLGSGEECGGVHLIRECRGKRERERWCGVGGWEWFDVWVKLLMARYCPGVRNVVGRLSRVYLPLISPLSSWSTLFHAARFNRNQSLVLDNHLTFRALYSRQVMLGFHWPYAVVKTSRRCSEHSRRLTNTKPQ